MTRLFDNSTVRAIINDQQRIGHALAPRHWHTYQPTERQLRVAIAKVLRSSPSEVHIARGIRLGVETAIQIQIEIFKLGEGERKDRFPPSILFFLSQPVSKKELLLQ